MLGDSRYCIQKKVWYGWKTILTFSTKEARDTTVQQLKHLPNSIFV
jgi:hypothetical protein